MKNNKKKGLSSIFDEETVDGVLSWFGISPDHEKKTSPPPGKLVFIPGIGDVLLNSSKELRSLANK